MGRYAKCNFKIIKAYQHDGKQLALGRLKNCNKSAIGLPSRKKQCNVTLVNQRHYTAQLISNTQAVTMAHWSGSCKKTSARELLVGVIAIVVHVLSFVVLFSLFCVLTVGSAMRHTFLTTIILGINFASKTKLRLTLFPQEVVLTYTYNAHT